MKTANIPERRLHVTVRVNRGTPFLRVPRPPGVAKGSSDPRALAGPKAPFHSVTQRSYFRRDYVLFPSDIFCPGCKPSFPL